MVCKSFVLNYFIKKRLIEKCKDLISVLFKGQASNPYSKAGIHLLLNNCN